MADYDWYSEVGCDAPLEQGDILLECPILVPDSPDAMELDEVPGKAIDYNVVLMSQSCDLAGDKITIALACPIFTLNELEEQNPNYANYKMKNALKKGYDYKFHMLKKCEHNALNSLKGHYLVVDFRNVCGIHIDFLRLFAKRAGTRVRLLPPYREHLSQAFARFFMRVGLPIDIPDFK